MRKKADKAGHEMLPEYDFRRGVRGKYADRFAAGCNVVVLRPDVAKVFPTSKAVNDTLEALVKLARKSARKIPA